MPPLWSSDLPQVWWIGTGLASSMPFHAAGNHVKDSTENAYYGAISSYTPSVRALASSRDREKSIGGVQDRLVIATMTETPGLTSLPGVAQEKREVLKWLTVSLRQRSSISQMLTRFSRALRGAPLLISLVMVTLTMPTLPTAD